MSKQDMPDFMKRFKPLKSNDQYNTYTLSNWMKAHEEINKATEDMDVHESEVFVGQLLYHEIVNKRRMHMINKLKGKLTFLSREREEKEILNTIAKLEAEHYAGKGS